MDNDFPIESSDEPPTLDFEKISEEEDLQEDHKAFIWWIVVFSCVYQTLHSLSSRAIEWLLLFLGSLLSVLGRFSNEISKIAVAFPSTSYKREKYLKHKLLISSVLHYVVCPSCLSIYKHENCLEHFATRINIKLCNECLNSRKHLRVPLLKQVITRKGNKKFYPFLAYPYASLIESLKFLFKRRGFYQQCEQWRNEMPQDLLCDVYDGKIWKSFLNYKGQSFLAEKNSIAFMLNIDWFQPYKHRVYSVGVIYLAIMNLPRAIRFKRENIILLGLIPGPSEPKLNINSYLTPLVSDLLELWNGISYQTYDSGSQQVRAALLCVGCDLPAGRKVCGFLSYSANLGCSRCYSNFGTGVFGVQNYSGFDRNKWEARTEQKHRNNIKKILACTTKTERERKESEFGCRYSSLLQLPYFDPVHMLIIDPMHNLYLGTAKHIFSVVWQKNELINRDDVDTINSRVMSLVVPAEVKFGSLPACLQYPKSLTAEQWMLWVNYYSVFCLHGILPPADLECWRHFVLASRILCQRKLTSDNIKVADALLMRFCSRFEGLYEPEAVTPNIHLHAHLTDCISDFGPMASFWLFSFERFNGILGDEPTNNRSIELQLMSRFVKDNAHLQLLCSAPPNGPSDITSSFSHSVLEHAFAFSSTQHLDGLSHDTSPQTGSETFIPAKKYCIMTFTKTELQIISNAILQSNPGWKELASLSFPRSYKKMSQVTINGQQISAGQYVLSKSVFPFVSSNSFSGLFGSPFRPAKVLYFLTYSIQLSEDESGKILPFVVVDWPMPHPLRQKIGKPCEVWCYSLFESCDKNMYVPIDYIVSPLLTARHIMEEENVLVTVPLVS